MVTRCCEDAVGSCGVTSEHRPSLGTEGVPLLCPPYEEGLLWPLTRVYPVPESWTVF